MDRKHFIKIVGASCVGAIVPLGISSCSPVHFVTASLDNNKLVVRKNEFIGIKKEVEFVRTFIAIESPTLQFPIIVYRHSDENYTALWTECTHQNCEVKPHDTLLSCPCHGSEFDVNGGVLEGPAESDLKVFEVSTDNDNIHVHIV